MSHTYGKRQSKTWKGNLSICRSDSYSGFDFRAGGRVVLISPCNMRVVGRRTNVVE